MIWLTPALQCNSCDYLYHLPILLHVQGFSCKIGNFIASHGFPEIRLTRLVNLLFGIHFAHFIFRWEDSVMAVKENAKTWAVKEQIIEDAVSGLTFQFEVMQDGKARLRVFGNFPLGNREFVFNEVGQKCGSGTATRGICRPAWMTKVDG
jgi:hypothetical protein